MASNANDKDTARPRFFTDTMQNKAASEKEGRPIFETKEMVEIFIPGDKLFRHVDIVQDKHKQRWPEAYAAFKRGEQMATTGTPLEHWPNATLTKSRVAELKAMHILSVEDLAGVPDNALGKMGMGSRELRDQAKAYINSAKAGAENAALTAEVSRLREMVEKLSGQTKELVEAPKEKTIEDCSDDELKEFIKRETGEAPRGRVSRETLLERAAQIATAKAEAA